MSDEKNIEKIKASIENTGLEKADKNYNSIIDYAKDLSCQPILKSNCKLCNSQFRKEAEDMFAEGKSSFFVYKWLKQKGQEISDKAVLNHYNEHYQRPIMEARIKVYAENLEDYSRIKMKEEDRLNLYATLLDQQIHFLGASINKVNIDDARRTHDTIIKMIGEAVKVQEKIRAMKQADEPVKILVEKLNNVMTIKWNDAKSVEAKQAIKDVLDVIIKEVKDMEIDNVN